MRKLRANHLKTLKVEWARIYILSVRQPWFLGNEVLTFGASFIPCSPILFPLWMPDTVGPHTQNEKRLLSASQVKVFLSTRMKSEKHNGSAPACSSVCPPVTRNILSDSDKTFGNGACHDSPCTGLPKQGTTAVHNTIISDVRLHSGILYNCTDICVLAWFCQNSAELLCFSADLILRNTEPKLHLRAAIYNSPMITFYKISCSICPPE